MVKIRSVAGAIPALLIVTLLFLAAVQPIAAQGDGRMRAGAGEAPPPAGPDEVALSRAGARGDLIEAIEQQKASLKALLVLREKDVQGGLERLAKLRDLYTDGLISRREFEEIEAEVAAARARAADVRQQIEAADVLHAESLLEVDTAETPGAAPIIATGPLPSSRDFLKKTAYIRSRGLINWSLADAGKIEGFFLSKFGRRLPVSAFGQSDLHNRWGYDHRQAMDVIVHPDSIEGQALMEYLQSAGVPFIAFRRAVSGSASGPHIHIGRPSQRLPDR